MKTKKKKKRRKNGPPRANWIWFFFPLPALWGKVNHPVFSEHLQFMRPYVLWGWALLKAVVTTQDGGSTLLPQYFWITSGHIYEYPLCHVTARCVPLSLRSEAQEDTLFYFLTMLTVLQEPRKILWVGVCLRAATRRLSVFIRSQALRLELCAYQHPYLSRHFSFNITWLWFS